MAEFRFQAEVIYWRGPSPFFFAPVPAIRVDAVRRAARSATYGWGVAPVEARIGDVVFRTALFPKDDTYLLPLRAEVRRRGDITAGDTVSVEMTIEPAGRGPVLR